MSQPSLNLQHSSVNQGENNNNNMNETKSSTSADSNAIVTFTDNDEFLYHRWEHPNVNVNRDGHETYIWKVNLGPKGFEKLVSRVVDGIKESWNEMLIKDQHGNRTPVKRSNDNINYSKILLKEKNVTLEEEDMI